MEVVPMDSVGAIPFQRGNLQIGFERVTPATPCVNRPHSALSKQLGPGGSLLGKTWKRALNGGGFFHSKVGR